MKITRSKTRQELLNNTVARYNSNNRGTHEDGKFSSCCYISKNEQKRCAIGVEVSTKLAQKLEGNVDGVYENYQFQMLPDRLKKMGQSFLIDIQKLHDSKTFWNEKGITNRGIEEVKIIVNNYSLKMPESILESQS